MPLRVSASASAGGGGSAFAGALRAVPLALALAACQRELPVLLYHEVGCGTRDVRDVPAEQFDAELGWLADHGWRFVPPEAVADPDATLPARAVAVTFDDGAACVYSAAFPILKRRNVPFALFVVTDWIGGDAGHRTFQPLEDGEKVGTLVWPEIRAMVDSGLARVGGHGRHHLYLRRADAGRLRDEIDGSRADILGHLGATAELFAFPFGAFNRAAIDEARLAGYRGAFAVGTGVGGTFAYRRRSVHRGEGEAAFADLLGDRWILPLANHD